MSEKIKARVWIGEKIEYTFRYTAPYPMTEKEVRKTLKLPKDEVLTPKKDRRMIHDGVWGFQTEINGTIRGK